MSGLRKFSEEFQSELFARIPEGITEEISEERKRKESIHKRMWCDYPEKSPMVKSLNGVSGEISKRNSWSNLQLGFVEDSQKSFSLNRPILGIRCTAYNNNYLFQFLILFCQAFASWLSSKITTRSDDCFSGRSSITPENQMVSKTSELTGNVLRFA